MLALIDTRILLSDGKTCSIYIHLLVIWKFGFGVFLASLCFSFGAETCNTEPTSYNLQHANDILRARRYGPNVDSDVVKIVEEGR